MQSRAEDAREVEGHDQQADDDRDGEHPEWYAPGPIVVGRSLSVVVEVDLGGGGQISDPGRLVLRACRGPPLP